MKVSVVIPVFNAEKYLKRCLDSVINQTYGNWEVIAIDDGSEDGSYSVMSSYASRDTRIKVFIHDNQGPGYTRNRGISLVTGDYIVFLDADDYINKNYFEDLVACVKAQHSDVVFINVLHEKPNGKLIRFEKMSRYKDCSKDTIIRHQLTGKMPWGGCRKAVRSSLIIKNEIRYSKDVVGEEALFSFKVLYKAEKISFIDKPCYHYINYPNSQSKKGDEDPWGEVCQKVGNYLREKELLAEYRKTLNSFGFTALVVSIYRKTQNYRFMETLKQSNVSLNEFKDTYGFDLDKDSLEVRIRCVLPFARIGIVLPIVVIAKLKHTLEKLNR